MAIDYAKDSKINVDALDIEVATQAEKEEKYIDQVRKLKTRSHRLEEELKTLRSELILRVNQNPQKYLGVDKATGPLIEAYYRTNKKYQKLKMAMIEAQDAAAVAEDMKDLFHFTRTKALDELVQLHGQNYFAGPKVPRNIKKEYERWEDREERQKERSKKIGKKLKRN